MSLWKKHVQLNRKQLDVQQLISRLKNISKQNNLEIVELAIQSIIEELEEQEVE